MAADVDEKRLLLVDDEIGYLDVLAKRLTHRGFKVTTASSGAEAIRALRKWEFDLAVVDLKMEDMDGIEVLKVLKKMDPVLQVIILTSPGRPRPRSLRLSHQTDRPRPTDRANPGCVELGFLVTTLEMPCKTAHVGCSITALHHL